MKRTTEFLNSDRYAYDFGLCSIKNGFAQVDTGQDASYFGTWANPERLMIVNYCEGDHTLQEAASVDEFTEEIRKIQKWNKDSGYSFGIDAGLGEGLKDKFENMGLGDLLH